MISHGNAEYSTRTYWDDRYRGEPQFDWFATVYSSCVKSVFSAIERVASARQLEQHSDVPVAPSAGLSRRVLKVLHLGAGNSNLCEDLHRCYTAKYPYSEAAPYDLQQVAVDYSHVVIDNMKKRHAGGALPCRPQAPETNAEHSAGVASFVEWVVADVRDLSHILATYGPHFDIAVDKGTMDALQTDDSDDADDNVHAMLNQVSMCLAGQTSNNSSSNDRSISTMDGGPCRCDGDAHHPDCGLRLFIQITWQIPYLRLSYTAKEPNHTYAWGDKVTYKFLGDSDVYRIYTYEVRPKASTDVSEKATC